MLCRTCWDETWQGTRCKTCGTPLFRQKSDRVRQAELREAAMRRTVAWASGLGLLVALAWANLLPRGALFFCAASGFLLALYLSMIGAVGEYEENWDEFWETYGPGVRWIGGPAVQLLVCSLRKQGVTDFLVLECAVILWNGPLMAVLYPCYDISCPLTTFAAAVFGWFCSRLVRPQWY
jgi:hypothetical protein